MQKLEIRTKIQLHYLVTWSIKKNDLKSDPFLCTIPIYILHLNPIKLMSSFWIRFPLAFKGKACFISQFFVFASQELFKSIPFSALDTLVKRWHGAWWFLEYFFLFQRDETIKSGEGEAKSYHVVHIKLHIQREGHSVERQECFCHSVFIYETIKYIKKCPSTI